MTEDGAQPHDAAIRKQTMIDSVTDMSIPSRSYYLMVSLSATA